MSDSWIVELVGLVCGFVLLARGADWLVDGGASLARRWGASPLTVGLTVVAWGTSMPEVVVSSLAAWEGKAGMSVGNVIGSNVANIGMVLGSTALILPAVLVGRIRPREGVWLIGSLVILWRVCGDQAVTRTEAVVMLAIFAVYNLVLFNAGRVERTTVDEREEVIEAAEEAADRRSRHPMTDVLIGAVAIAVGAKLVMFGAEGLAIRAGISDTVIGLTIFAVGTSLPELAAGVGSALKGHHEIGFGNVIGSNVFNSLAVIGIAGALRPFGGAEVASELEVALSRDFPVNLAFSVALVVLPWLLLEGGRVKAGLLLTGYAVYVASLLV